MRLSLRKRAFLIQYGGIALFLGLGTLGYGAPWILFVAVVAFLASGFWLRLAVLLVDVSTPTVCEMRIRPARSVVYRLGTQAFRNRCPLVIGIWG
jgi:hypothetical protein